MSASSSVPHATDDRRTACRRLLRPTNAARTGTAAEGRALALQALADGRLIEDPGPESGGFWVALAALALAHADDDAVRVSSEVIEWAKRHGSQPAFSMGAQLRAYVLLRGGSLEEAEADARSALEHPALPRFSPFGMVALVNVLLLRGKLSEAEEALAQTPFDSSRGHSLFAVRYLQTRARVHSASRRPEEALDDLFACGGLEQEWDIRTPAFGTWRADAAPLLASLDREDEARVLAQEELERCDAFGARGPLGISLRTLGLIEPADTGIGLLEQAVAQLEQSSRRLEHAVALLELGAAIRRGGRRAEAREPLRKALELAHACGADTIAERAHDELVTAGARPRRDPTESRSTLTASEGRVARMAAEGMTNRAIAQALFLTENTIETHLRSVFRKLQIHSRTQLARAL